MCKKYLVCPGYVRSKSDGDRHFIGARALMRLYKVDPRECVILKDGWNAEGYQKELIQLRPDYHGNYVVPEV